MSKKRKCSQAKIAIGVFAGLAVIIGAVVSGLNMHKGKLYHSVPL